MQIRPLDLDDDALAAWYDVYHAAAVHGRVHPTAYTREEKGVLLRSRSPGERRIAFEGVVEPGEGRVAPVVCGVVGLPLKENLQIAWVGVWTAPEHRGRGYGSAMLERLVQVARENGRSKVLASVVVPYDVPSDGSGHPDIEWCRRRGFALDISNVVRLLHLPVADELLAGLAEQAAPYHEDYTFRRFVGPVPDDLLVEFGQLIGALMVEAPSGEVPREHEVMDEERIRADEADFAASGRTKYTMVALAPDGSPAAYTELVAPRYDADHLYQWGTLVVTDHRGHRLGLAIKARTLQWVQQEEPGRRFLVTYNAEVNEHMIAINEALGFRPVEREIDLVRSF